MYRNGQGVPQDHAEALKWYRRAAEQGDAAAQYNLGQMYRTGQGVPQDHAEALKWYRRAAEQGDADAQHNLGFMYRNGQGVPQDHAEAVKWYRRAAEQGNALAQNNLGVMYGTGKGVPQDYVQAHLWYNLAASTQKEPEERERAARNRDLVAARMTPAQIAEAQRLAREWRPKTAAATPPPATPQTSGSIVIQPLLEGRKTITPDWAAINAVPLGDKGNPVRVHLAGQEAYLSRLVCSNGAPPTFYRVGSFGVGVYGTIVDGYDVDCAGSKRMVFMDMYHPNYVEPRPVPGFTIRAP